MFSCKKSFLHPALLLCIILFTALSSEASETYLEKGIAEYKSENFQEALELFVKARESQPESSVAAFYLGLAYKQTGMLKESAANYRDAINLTPPVIDAYPELIEVLYNLNQLEEAKSLIEKAKEKNIKPAHVSFLEGLVLAKEGRNDQAIDAFSRAQSLDKSLTQASAFQIAMLHTKGRRFAEARESLKTVINVNPASEIASFAKEYESALTRNLKTYREWRFTAGLAYQYDDNVVLRPSNTTAVDITGEKDSAIVSTLRIDYAPLTRAPWLFNGQINFYASTYGRNETHNIIAPSVSLIPGYSFQNGAATLPLTYSHVWLEEKEYMKTVSAKPTLSLMIGSGQIGQFSLGYSNRKMLKKPLYDDEDRDGSVYSVSAGAVHPFLAENSIMNLRYEFSNDKTEGKNWENTGHRFDLAVLVPIVKKVRLALSGEAFLQSYRNTHTAFKIKRKDEIYLGSANIIWELLKGLKFNIQYSHTTANSNIEIYDYKRNIYTAGLEYNF